MAHPRPFARHAEGLRARLSERIPALLSGALLAGFLTGVVPAIPVLDAAAPAAATNASTSCLNSSNYDYGPVTVTPLHGKAFYTDLRNGFDATYVGYRIENDSNSNAIKDLWLEIGNFRTAAGGSSVMSLANPADAYQPIGDLAAGGSKVIYVLLKATAVSETEQRHDIRIHQGYPNGTTSLHEADALCYFGFTKVFRTLAASANKVTSVSVNTTSPRLGGTVVATVNGRTGVGGAGSAPDFSVMWLSGASQSTWPTRALRLESTAITVRGKSGNTTFSGTNVLLVTDINNRNKFTSGTTYTATFTYRVLGSTTSAPEVRPVAHIASGTQMKHTGSYPTAAVTIATNQIANSISVGKTVVGSISKSGSVFPVTYRVTVTDSVTASTVDQIVDDVPAGAVFVAGSAQIVDATRTSATTIANPVNIGTSGDPKYVFAGPFTLRGSAAPYTATLEYRVNLPAPASGSTTYLNTAYALVGSTLVGRSDLKVAAAAVVATNTTATADTTTVEADKPKQPQVIDFPQPGDLGVGSVGQLSAVASSSLQVTYTSTTTSICTVSGDQVIAVATGACIIQASQPGDANWDLATAVTRTLQVLAGQVITFNPSSPMAINETQSVVAESNSTLQVTLTVLSIGVCTVDGGTSSSQPSPFVITAVTQGQCVIVASRESGTVGSVTFGRAMDVERTINIGTSQYIDFPAIANQANSVTTVNISAASKATSNNANTSLPVSFTSQTPGVCTVTDDPTTTAKTSYVGTVTKVADGICTITASQDGLDISDNQSIYAPATDVTRSFRLGTNVPTVVVVPSVNEIPSGGTFTAVVTVTRPASGTAAMTGQITLYANGSRVASSASQLGTLVPAGDGVTGSVTLTLGASVIPTGADNGLIILSATYNGTAYPLSSTTQDVEVHVLAPGRPGAVTGNVSAVESTTATLAGSMTPNDPTSAATAGIRIGTVNPPMDTITVTQNGTGTGPASLPVSGPVTGLVPATLYFYQVTATRGDYTDVGDVKSFVTKPGAVTPRTPTIGSTQIQVPFDTVTSGPGVTIQYTLACTDTATPAVTSSVTGANSPLTLSGLLPQMSYSCFIFAASSATGAQGGGAGETTTVLGSGASGAALATGQAKSPRTAGVTVSRDLQTFSESATVTFLETATLRVTGTTSGNPSPLDADTDGLKYGTRVSGPCSLSGLVVVPTGVGTCIISGGIGEGETYTAVLSTAPETVTVNINRAPRGISILPSSFSQSYTTWGQTPPTLISEATHEDLIGTKTYVLAPGSTGCTVDTVTAAVTFTGAGTCRVSVSITVGTNFESATSAAISFEIGRKDHTITMPTTGGGAVGDPDRVLPTGTSETQTVTYTTSDPAVCTIVGTAPNFSVRLVGPGTCTVTASSPQSIDYNAATGTLTWTFPVTGGSGGSNPGNNNPGNNNGGGNSGGGGTPPVTPPTPPTPPGPAPIQNPTPVPPRPNDVTADKKVEVEGPAKQVIDLPNTTPATPVRVLETVQAALSQRLIVTPSNGDLSVTPVNGWTGRTVVPVIKVLDNKEVEVLVEVTVNPAAPAQGTFTPRRLDRTTLTWQPSPSQVVRYEVNLDGERVCVVLTNSCVVDDIVGPKSVIEVTAIGNDNTQSRAVVPTYRPERPIPALVVNFAEDSSVLTRTAQRQIRNIARIIEREGFTSLQVFGHTDSQGGQRNAAPLSRARAEVTRAFLQRLLPNVRFRVIAGFGLDRPVASNASERGRAANRRAELEVVR